MNYIEHRGKHDKYLENNKGIIIYMYNSWNKVIRRNL